MTSTESLPLVTVIVPVYNAEKYLAATIDSIRAQHHRALQIILVDDGSRDGSGTICDDAAACDDRILVIHQKNGGIAAAQNAGLDAARGDYVTFCDNDDLMSPWMVSRLVSISRDNDADMSCCRWINPGASQAAAQLERVSQEPTGHVEVVADPARAYQTVFPALLRRIRRQQLRYFSEANWGKLYRRALFDGIRFPDGRYAQDVAVAMSLYLGMNRVASCSDPLYLWLQRGDSVSHSLRATSYYSDIVAAHARSFVLALDHGILPARASYGLGAIVDERRSIRSREDRLRYERDRSLVASLRSRLSPRQRLVCAFFGAVRRIEVLVYDRTVHRRR